MKAERLRELLEQVARGEVEPAQAVLSLRSEPTDPTESFANLDHDRASRRGIPEVVLGEGKTDEQVIGIVRELAARSDNLLATRIDAERAPVLLEALQELDVVYDADARLLYRRRDTSDKGRGVIAVLSAGTADLPAAREAARCLEVMGHRVAEYVDIGVAGLHRFTQRLPEIREAKVVICVAGMEAALPSVVAGQLSVPVIAVPTSVGYGSSFGGMAALLGCLNSCAAGVLTVNIDNGFGAAYAAAQINRA